MRKLYVLIAILALVGLATLSRSNWAQAPQQAPTSSVASGVRTAVEPGPAVYKLEDAYLNWRVAPSEQAYTVIDGKHLHTYIDELAAISLRYRDAGHPQFWGRIEGTSGDAETAQWVSDKFKQAGLTDVRTQSFDLPPQWIPQSWDVSATENGKTLSFPTLQPAIHSVGTQGGGLDLEAVYVGLGNEGDFTGRDVRGKAALIYSMPEPGVWARSDQFSGAVQRAEAHGAAAVFVTLCMPGNVSWAFPLLQNGKTPEFIMGLEDGEAMRGLIERAPAGQPAHLKVRLDVQMVPDLKTANVWGVLPGMTDEKIIVIAHRDGYFQASGDNASGVATMVGLAEYFAKIPKEKRRRTIEFIGTSGHHGTSMSVPWLAQNKDTALAKVALVMNAEHTALTQQYLFAGKMRPANTTSALHWNFNGSQKLVDIGVKSFDAFGVPTYTGTDGVAFAEISSVSHLVPSFGVINVDTYYHSSAETPDKVPWTGLGAVTRAFAKIIDDVNKVDIKDLQPQQHGDVGQ